MIPAQPSAELTAIAEAVDTFRCHKYRNLGKMLSLAWRQYTIYVEERFKELGHANYRTTWMAVLSNLDPTGNTIVELAERIRYSKQAVGKIVRELEESGYVMAETHPHDKRAQLVRFTDRGVSLLRDAVNNVGLVREHLTRDLTEDDVTTLLSLLERLVKSNMHLLENRQLEPMPNPKP